MDDVNLKINQEELQGEEEVENDLVPEDQSRTRPDTGDSETFEADPKETELEGNNVEVIKKKKKKVRRKRKKGRKIKVPKGMVIDENGDILTAKEYLLKKTLNSTNASLDAMQSRLRELTLTNIELKQSFSEQEKEALHVISALHEENDQTSQEIKVIHAEMKRMELEAEGTQERVRNENTQRIEEMIANLNEKNAEYKILQQEFSIIKEFRRKRTDLVQELENSQKKLAETEISNQEQLTKMERKFFQDKVRLQKDATRKIGELAAKAHNEAVLGLNDTTKDVYKENLRMTEALVFHTEEGTSLNALNSELITKNDLLIEENRLHGAIVKKKIQESKAQESEILQLSEKKQLIENSLIKIVQDFEQERDVMVGLTKSKLLEVRNVAMDITVSLRRKTAEILHIKRLAQHLLDQRTDMEDYFLVALEEVKSEVKNDLAFALRKNQEKLSEVKPDEQQFGVAQFGSFKPLEKIQDKRPLKDDTSTVIKCMKWKEKEKVLRRLFIKMNNAQAEEIESVESPALAPVVDLESLMAHKKNHGERFSRSVAPITK